MSVSDLQFQYNGLTLGDGTSYDIVAVRGLMGPGQARVADVLRPLDHGAFVNGADYAPIRHVEIDVQVEGSSDAVFAANVDALLLAFAPQSAEMALTFQLPGFSNGNRYINCRPRATTVAVDITYKFRMPVWTIVLDATDPRIYDATLQQITLAAPAVSGGLAFPLHFPLSFGTATGGSTIITNAGSFETRPVITINGPLTSPQIINNTSGLFTLIDLTLNNGDVLTIDYLAKTILLGGTASRYFALDNTSTWWTLAPGANQISISAASGTGNAVVAFRNAWI